MSWQIENIANMLLGGWSIIHFPCPNICWIKWKGSFFIVVNRLKNTILYYRCVLIILTITGIYSNSEEANDGNNYIKRNTINFFCKPSVVYYKCEMKRNRKLLSSEPSYFTFEGSYNLLMHPIDIWWGANPIQSFTFGSCNRCVEKLLLLRKFVAKSGR